MPPYRNAPLSAEQRQRFGDKLIGAPRAVLAYRPQPFCNVGHGDINQTIVIFSELIIFAWNHMATNGWFCIKRFVIYHKREIELSAPTGERALYLVALRHQVNHSSVAQW